MLEPPVVPAPVTLPEVDNMSLPGDWVLFCRWDHVDAGIGLGSLLASTFLMEVDFLLGSPCMPKSELFCPPIMGFGPRLAHLKELAAVA